MNGPATRCLLAAALPVLLTGCPRSSAGDKGSTSASPSASPAPVASSAPAPAASAPREQAPPSGGVATWEPGEAAKECAMFGREIDSNLYYGSLSVASKGKETAMTRFLRSGTKGEGQLAFGGYDNQGRSIATSHGLGRGQLRPTWLFPRKEEWLVFWFDAQGLNFTRAGWAATVNKIGRFPAINLEESERVNFSSMGLDEPVLGVSPLTHEPIAQLGLYLFNPLETVAEIVKVVGATHHAVKPRNPSVAASAEGFFLAWVDEGEGGKSIVAATRFDKSGKELGPQLTLSTPGRAARQPALLLTDKGALIAWTEQNGATEDVVVQAIDKAWQPVGGVHRVDRGTSPALTLTKAGAALTFLRQAAEGPLHSAIVHVDAAGQPGSRGILLSPDKPKEAIKEPPAITLTEEGRIGVAFTFSDGMRSQMRTIRAECLAPTGATASPATSGSAAPDRPAPPG